MIELDALSKKYGNTIALDNINLSLKLGQVIGIVGKNGSGKSTLIKILLGLITSYQGQVKLSDFSTLDVALASENINLPSSYTAKKILKYFSIIKKSSSEEIDELVHLLALDAHINKQVSKLSQGNKQRLNIAIALLGNPKLVIFDEPNNGLDPSGFILLRDIILDLKKHNKTVIIASHLLNEIESVCDHIVFLEDGRVIESKSKLDLLAKYDNLEDAYVTLLT